MHENILNRRLRHRSNNTVSREFSRARHLVSRKPKAGTQLILLRRRASAGAHVARSSTASRGPQISPVGQTRASGRSTDLVFKTRFSGPGPNSSSRRRSRGTEVRFGPLVDSYCRMQRAAYAGGDPEAPWSYSEPRHGRTARRYHTGARITLR